MTLLIQKERVIDDVGAQTAEQTKHQLILEGEAQKRALILNADGALDKKLEAYVKVNENYADAIKDAKPGAWTPSVVMGQDAAGGNQAQSLVDLLTAKTAGEIGLDLTMTKVAVAKK